jgi:hypothetical protein
MTENILMKTIIKENGNYIIKEIPLTEAVLKSDAYWVNPSGKIINVATTHINHIIKNPTSYKLTKDKIDAIYKKHNEPIGLEGNAREEIMKGLLIKGWIRIRFVKRRYSWTVQTGKLSKNVKDLLQQWAQEMVKSKIYTNADVVIITNNSKISKSIEDISNDVLYNEGESVIKNIILEKVEQF